ncbi:MAG TPA: tRNA uridine-5-carboxymethylaminomethyl(34) synthesis GTPase MnmE [Acidobacteriaceae bacterium]|nr:tRNA uridine-5-carboxymethylaminomethyl(34) synthesis GTPase MnmE [Acidobacteriaceae bacterium]
MTESIAATKFTEDTIVAIATPPGRGGIGIVRLSGRDAQRLLSPHLELRSPLLPGRARYCAIVDAGARLDEGVVTWFAAPNSYTGEDVLEVAAHGSPVILDLLVRRALEAGGRLARPGEFTERAFLHGRIDLTQAEAVRDLIAAETLYQVRVAAEQLGGALSRRVAPVKEQLIALVTLLEAGIDFAEDDVDVTPDAEIRRLLDAIDTALAPIAASFREGRLVHNGLTLAIVGRPNAGKSSLFNRLVERERAIVTAMPGTTRDLVTERIALGGIPVELVDTAGLREAKDEAESHGIARTESAMADADLVLLLLDATAAIDSEGVLRLPEEDARLLASLEGRSPVLVLNKIDLVRPERLAAIVDDLAQVSALTGEGVAELRAQLLERLRGSGSSAGNHAEGGMLTSLRHYEALAGCIQALRRARVALAERVPHEMLLLDLYAALQQLDQLTGATTADDILNRIFSSFCIGK